MFLFGWSMSAGAGVTGYEVGWVSGAGQARSEGPGAP